MAISDAINESLDKGSCLILDFIGWQNTHFIALHSGLPRNEIVIAGGAKNSTIPILEIHEIMEEFDKGLILLKKGSRLSHTLEFNEDDYSFVFEIFKFQNERIFQNDAVVVMSWRKTGEGMHK